MKDIYTKFIPQVSTLFGEDQAVVTLQMLDGMEECLKHGLNPANWINMSLRLKHKAAHSAGAALFQLALENHQQAELIARANAIGCTPQAAERFDSLQMALQGYNAQIDSTADKVTNKVYAKDLLRTVKHCVNGFDN